MFINLLHNQKTYIMKPAMFSNLHPMLKFAFAIILALSSMLIFTLLGILAGIPFFDTNIFGLMQNIESMENINFIKYLQLVQSIGLFVVPAILLGYLFYGTYLKSLSLSVKPKPTSLLIVAFTMLAAIPFINFLAELNSTLVLPDFLSSLEQSMKEMEEKAMEMTQAFLNVSTIQGLLINLLIVAVAPAIGEELLFRGVIQRIFTNWTNNKHWGIIIAAILFSAMHMQFYGFLPRMMMGVFFGYLLVWSGSMWLPITAHFINNGMAVLVSYLINKSVIGEDIESIGSGSNAMQYILMSITIITLLIVATRIKEKETF